MRGILALQVSGTLRQRDELRAARCCISLDNEASDCTACQYQCFSITTRLRRSGAYSTFMSGPGDIYDGSIDNRSAFPPLLSPSPATPASPPYLVSLLSCRRHRAQVTMLQDSLPLDEPVSTSANLGLVKWMSEVTESEVSVRLSLHDAYTE